MKKTYIQPEMLHFVLDGVLLTGASATIKQEGTNATVKVTDESYDDVFCSRQRSIWDDDEEEEDVW